MQSNPEHPAAGTAVVYVRLSGQPYGYDPFSPDNQRRICRDHARNHRVEIVAEYQDLAVSGRKGRLNGLASKLHWSFSGDRWWRFCTLPPWTASRGAVCNTLQRCSKRSTVLVDASSWPPTAWTPVWRPTGRQSRHSLSRPAPRPMPHRGGCPNGTPTTGAVVCGSESAPFGYIVANGNLEPHPTEAPIVRAMVDSFLAGSSLRGIARWLNAEDVKPPRLVFYEEAMAKGYSPRPPPATSWSYVAVRGVLAAPALAALMSHAGELCRDERGHPIVAGVGIVTQDERVQILAGLRHRASRGGTRQGGRWEAGSNPQPKYLLTGLGRCGDAARRSSAS